MQRRLAHKEVKESGGVSLNHKEKELFERYAKQRRTNDCVLRVRPYPGAYKVRVPWCG